jgi:SAM-dependent methyltransferase
LVLSEGLWQPTAISKVSYPEEGNDLCLQVESSSYWFAHRNRCLLEIMRSFPPSGTLYDIGGGNGFVSLGLQKAGLGVVLLEPGRGARNARARGVENVIWSTLEEAGLRPESVADAGAFDVVEHIEDDAAFLSSVESILIPGGRFYCTVPAGVGLWSDEDVHAGHFRRYSVESLRAAMTSAGLQVEFISPFFTWLVPMVFLLRVLPFRLRGSQAGVEGRAQAVKGDHTLPWMLRPFVNACHAWELARLRAGRPLRCGTSLLCVARKSSSDMQ